MHNSLFAVDLEALYLCDDCFFEVWLFIFILAGAWSLVVFVMLNSSLVT